MGGKWLGLLAEIAPGVRRVAMMFNPNTAPQGGSYFLPSFEAAARALKMEVMATPTSDDAEIDSVIASLGHRPGGGFVVAPDVFMLIHRARILSQAARNSVPGVFATSLYARDGGLCSYGADRRDLFRRSAEYIDRILRGAKPADLPVQQPTKFELVINLKTAKALGITIPLNLLAIADEVIE
jgi:putative ABC transport system substrate-binding protein